MSGLGRRREANPFVSGYFDNGQLILQRQSGTSAQCDVLIFLGNLVNNEDCTFDIVFTA